MATPDVFGTIGVPAGSVPLGTKVRLRLVTSEAGDAPAFAFTVGGTMVGGADAWAHPNKVGVFTFADVNPIVNAEALLDPGDDDYVAPTDDAVRTPSGCVYQILVTYPDGTEVVDYHTVPDHTAGPVELGTATVTTAPSNLPPPGASNAALGGKLTGTVADADFVDGAVDSDAIATGAVGTTELASGAATTAKIADSAVTAPKIADEAITRAKHDDDVDTRDRARQYTTELQAWNKALATVRAGGLFSGRAVAIIGDSITELGSFRGVNTTLAKRYNPSALVSAYVPVAGGLVEWDGTDGTEVGGRGFASYACRLTNGQTRSLTATCDAFSLWWLTEAGGGSLELRVDGSLVTTQAAATAGSYVWSGTFAEHEFEITSVGTTLVDGGYYYASNLLSGISTWEFGHSGYDTADILANPDLMSRLTALSPKLVILASGINDFADGVAAYTSRMTELVGDVQTALPNASVAVWIPPETSAHAPWEPFVAAARALCRATGAVPIDAYEVFGSALNEDNSAIDDPEGMWSDGIHFSSKGSDLNASLTLGVILGNQQDGPARVDLPRTSMLIGSESEVANRARIDATDAFGDLMVRMLTNDGLSFIPVGVAEPTLSVHTTTKNYVDTATGLLVPKSLVDAKGDLLVGTADNTVARLAVGANGTTLLADSTATPGVAWGHSPHARSAYLAPSGAIAETLDRLSSTFTNGTLLSSGRLHMVAVVLPAGKVITSITFRSGTTALSGGTNQWFGLWDSSRNQLRLTSDDTSTAWASNSPKTLNLTSTFTTTYTGLYYLSIMVAATTVITAYGVVHSTANVTGSAPVVNGFANTGLTNPASAPATASALTGHATVPYAYCS